MAAEIVQVTGLSPHHEDRIAPLVSAVPSVLPRPALPAEAVALPVLPALQELLPGGLPHGSVVAMGAWSLLCLALVAGASAAGAWCAAVGLPALGVAAAADAGLDPDRLLLIPEPGSGWPQVVASLLDGCELVLLRPPSRPPASLRRRLESVARRHGSILVIAGEWEGAQATLTIAHQEWVGIGTGSGRLQARRAHVVAGGRGAAARPRARWLWLPGPDGAVSPVAPAAGSTAAGITAAGTTEENGAAVPLWRGRTAG